MRADGQKLGTRIQRASRRCGGYRESLYGLDGFLDS